MLRANFATKLFSHRNEKDVGSAIRKSGIPREDIFVTTKARIDHLHLWCHVESLLDLNTLALEFRSWKGEDIESV